MRLDLSGKRFGKLTAIRSVGQSKHKKQLWLVHCDCGNEKTMVASSMASGHAKSCGYCDVQKKWTEEEKQFLIDNHERYTSPQFAEKLGRSLASVQMKRQAMGLYALEAVRRDALREQKIGVNNPNWKGEECKRRGGNDRARRLYPEDRPCERCNIPKGERHHKDGNTLNNTAENIEFLCRRHHMEADTRLATLINRNQKEAI